MEEQQRLEMAQRITDLRERSPFTQPVIADKLGIGLRAYQKLEQRGTTSFERCQEIYEIHREWTSRQADWSHVDSDWIWDGRTRAETPDLMGALLPATSQLDRIETMLAAVVEHLDIQPLTPSEVADVTERALQQYADKQSQSAPAPRRRRGSAQG
jgi:transcriptional regulator with XRE-family HTH domain